MPCWDANLRDTTQLRSRVAHPSLSYSSSNPRKAHSRLRAKPVVVYSVQQPFGTRLRGDFRFGPDRWAHTVPNSLVTCHKITLPRQSLSGPWYADEAIMSNCGMTGLEFTAKTKPVARGVREFVGGGVRGAPTVTFGATSLREGGKVQSQVQLQNQIRALGFVLEPDLPLPPSLREGAAKQPGGSARQPVAHTIPKNVSLMVRS